MKTIKMAVMCLVFFTAVTGLSAQEKASSGAVVVSSAAAPPSGLVAGYRGAVIPVSGDQLLYLKRGDHVDVLVTFDAIMGKKGETTKEKVTTTILQNILVLNVYEPKNREDSGALELLCNPVEAQYVALSVPQANRITIVVRGPGDTELHPMDIASFRKLIR